MPERFFSTTATGGTAVRWAEPVERDEFVAGVVFNAGRVDEPLVDSGVAHLAEHLVLPPLIGGDLRFGGSVSVTQTDLWFVGSSPEEALRPLRESCARVVSLPAERFERERSILRAEGDAAGHPANSALALRYGPRGFGVAGYGQLALGWLQLGDVQRWAERYLCSGNAGVWMNFEPPTEFALPLPTGPRNARDERLLEPMVDVQMPAFALGRPGAISLQVIRPRSGAGVAAVQVLVNRLLVQLRVERGLSYSVLSVEEPLTLAQTAATIWTDARPEHAPVCVDVIWRSLLDLAHDGCTAGELEEVAKHAQRHLKDPRALNSLLRGDAAAAVGIASPLDVDTYVGELRALTPDDVSGCAKEMVESALLVAPAPSSAPEGLSTYPRSSTRRVHGPRFEWRSAPKHAVATAGAYAVPEGVSVVFADGRQATIRYEQAPLMLQVDKDRRALWSHDGSYVEVDAALFKHGDQLVELIDDGMPADRVRIDQEQRKERDEIREQLEPLFDDRPRLIAMLGALAVLWVLLIAAIPRAAPSGFGVLLYLTVRTIWKARAKPRPERLGIATTQIVHCLQGPELVECVAVGKLRGEGRGFLLLTDHRLVFLRRGVTGVSINRADISRVESGSVFSSLRLHEPNRSIGFSGVTRRRRKSIAATLNQSAREPLLHEVSEAEPRAA